MRYGHRRLTSQSSLEVMTLAAPALDESVAAGNGRRGPASVSELSPSALDLRYATTSRAAQADTGADALGQRRTMRTSEAPPVISMS